ncbi:MAG: ribonuclease Z, partial [Rikenellaceae bacterium]
MTFRLTVLGTCSALPTVSKHQTAHVLNVREQFYLLDAGEGVQKGLKKCDVNMMKLNHIFISHLHGDHVFGLFGLLSTMSMLKRERALEIYAPAPIREILEFHCRMFERGKQYPIIIHELQTKNPELVYENSVMTVHTIPLKHTLDSVGYLFREKEPARNILPYTIQKYGLSLAEIATAKRGEDIRRETGEVIENSVVTYRPFVPRAFAYCLDTGYTPKFTEQIRGVNLLMIDSTFLASDKSIAGKRGHCTAEQAATIAKDAEVGKLLLTHFSTRYNTLYAKGEDPFLLEARPIFENSEVAKE